MEGYFVKRVSNTVTGSSYYIGQYDGQKTEASLRGVCTSCSKISAKLSFTFEKVMYLDGLLLKKTKKR